MKQDRLGLAKPLHLHFLCFLQRIIKMVKECFKHTPERYFKQSSTALLGPTLSPDRFLFCKTPLLPFHNLQRQSFPTARPSWFCTNRIHPYSQHQFFLQKSIAISYPIYCGDGEGLIPFQFAAAFYILKEMSFFSLSQFFPFFFVKLLFLCQIVLFPFLQNFPFSVCISLELQCANNHTAAEVCSGTQSQPPHLAGCTAAPISLTALSGSRFPRVFMTILSSQGKTDKLATLDKLKPHLGHNPLEAPCCSLQNLVASCSCFPSHRAEPSDFIHYLRSISPIFQYNFWIPFPSSNTSKFSPRCTPDLKSCDTIQSSSSFPKKGINGHRK